MQTFAFTNMSQLLDTMGVVGIRRPKVERLREFLRWKWAAMLWNAIWSLIFGDDILKAIVDPIHNKSSLGSHLPVVGNDIDYGINKLPWRENSYYDRPAHEQLWDNTAKVASAYLEDAEHKEREALIYATQYMLPYIGIGGGTMTQNIIKMESARQNEGRYERVDGALYKDLGDLNNPLRWTGGVMFGTKAVDEPESLVQDQEK